MNTELWIGTIILALAMAASGAMKAFAGKEKLLKNPRMAWAGDFSDRMIRSIGAIEVVGAIGLILPGITGIAPILVPLAAVGLAIIMLGAVIVHVRRGDGIQAAVVPFVFMLMAIFIAWGRFGEYAL
jgi:hypothetical protein